MYKSKRKALVKYSILSLLFFSQITFSSVVVGVGELVIDSTDDIAHAVEVAKKLAEKDAIAKAGQVTFTSQVIENEEYKTIVRVFDAAIIGREVIESISYGCESQTCVSVKMNIDFDHELLQKQIDYHFSADKSKLLYRGIDSSDYKEALKHHEAVRKEIAKGELYRTDIHQFSPSEWRKKRNDQKKFLNRWGSDPSAAKKNFLKEKRAAAKNYKFAQERYFDYVVFEIDDLVRSYNYSMDVHYELSLTKVGGAEAMGFVSTNNRSLVEPRVNVIDVPYTERVIDTGLTQINYVEQMYADTHHFTQASRLNSLYWKLIELITPFPTQGQDRQKFNRRHVFEKDTFSGQYKQEDVWFNYDIRYLCLTDWARSYQRNFNNPVYESLFKSRTYFMGRTPWGKFKFDPIRDDVKVKQGLIPPALKSSMSRGKRLCLISDFELLIYKFVPENHVRGEQTLFSSGVSVRVFTDIRR